MRQRSILITGASRGIGAACARLFASRGWAVGLHYFRSEAQALALARTLEEEGATVLPLRADLRDEAQVRAMVDTLLDNFCQLDALLCNAGVSSYGLLTETEEAEFWQVQQVNLGGVYRACRAVVPHFLHHKAGRIITVSSVWGLVGASMETAYSASKAAVIGLTKALAKELAPSNITVNCVAPGAIDTDMTAELGPEARARLLEETPLGRIGNAGDIAETVWFLAGPGGSFYTGQVLSPNGGFVI